MSCCARRYLSRFIRHINIIAGFKHFVARTGKLDHTEAATERFLFHTFVKSWPSYVTSYRHFRLESENSNSPLELLQGVRFHRRLGFNNVNCLRQDNNPIDFAYLF